MSDNILYYPYISLPENLWTYRTLLYYDELGVIVPNDFFRNPEKHNPKMLELIRADLVRQIDPRDFTQNLENFKDGFIEELLKPKSYVNNKRQNFKLGNYTRIHVEKFDNGLMNILQELKLAKHGQGWAWWNVEPNTAHLLMTYLASIISILDNRTPITDTIKSNKSKYTNTRDNKKLKLRNQILKDVMPLPSEINIRKLEIFKGKYQNELSLFRKSIEQLIIEVNNYKDDLNDFKDIYKLKIDEINDRKAFLRSQMDSPSFGKIVFGTLCTVTASGIALVDTPEEKILWALPSIISAAYSVITSHQRSEILSKEDFRYLALIDKKLS